MRFCRFEPCFDEHSTVLILGSFPSVKSRANNFYYGNAQNRFWKVVSKFFNQPLPQTILSKRQLILQNHLALWDVVSECEIEGSLDSCIKNYKVVDLTSVLSKSSIKSFILNGLKSAEIFKQRYPQFVDRSVVLPSTSPANTRFDEQVWFSALRKLGL